MREDEADSRMPYGELGQLLRVRCFLPGVVSPAVLPDMVQHRNSAMRGHLADGIEQWIVRSPAGRELDADHAAIEAALKLTLGVGTKVRIDDAIAANALRMGALKVEKTV